MRPGWQDEQVAADELGEPVGTESCGVLPAPAEVSLLDPQDAHSMVGLDFAACPLFHQRQPPAASPDVRTYFVLLGMVLLQKLQLATRSISTNCANGPRKLFAVKRSVARASLHYGAVRSLLAFFEVAEMDYCAPEEAEIAAQLLPCFNAC